MTNSSINLIKNKFNSAKNNTKKADNNLLNNKDNKGMFTNFIKNKCNIVNINLNDEETIINKKSIRRILSNDNKKIRLEKKNYYDIDNIFKIKKKKNLLNNEGKIKFNNKYISKMKDKSSVIIKDEK